jgi:hypothetical protein
MLAIAAGGASVVRAADWQLDPSVEVGALVNDNYTLAVNDLEVLDVTGGIVDAILQMRASSPRSQWVFEPRVRALQFPDESEIDTTDFFFNVLGEQRGERNSFGLAADISDQDVILGQLPGAVATGSLGLGQDPGPDAGRIAADNRQRVLRARPYAEFKLSQVSSLRVEARVEDVSFDVDFANAFVSYQSLGAAVQLGRRFTPASQFSLRLDYQEVEPDAGLGRADLLGALVQWDYQVGERATAYARAGAKQTTTERPGATPRAPLVEVEDTTPLFAAGVRWSFLKSELLVDYQRSIDANTTGFVVDRDDLRIFYNYRFSVRFRGFAAAYGVRDEAINITGVIAPRRYVTASTGIEWRFRKSMSLLGQIDASTQKFDGDPTSADSTAARVSFLYRPYRRD